MPIRPENVARYGPDWPAITFVIKWVRALGRCECDGRCGRPAGHLDRHRRCVNIHGRPAYLTGSRVVLITAHLDHTPENMHPANLRAMCNACTTTGATTPTPGSAPETPSARPDRPQPHHPYRRNP